jgi:hypothetical protein
MEANVLHLDANRAKCAAAHLAGEQFGSIEFGIA